MRNIITITWCLLIAGHYALSLRMTGEEVSSQDILLLQGYCYQDTEIEVLTVNTGEPLKPLVYKKNWMDCLERLSKNNFLWVDANHVRTLVHPTSGTLLMRIPQYGLLNMANPREIHNIGGKINKRKDALVEIRQENLHQIVKIIGRVPGPRYKLKPMEDYGYLTANKKGQILLNDTKEICLDFDGYSRLLLNRQRHHTDWRRSLCYDQQQQIAISGDLVPGMSYRVTGHRDLVVYEAEVELPLQLSNGRGVTIRLSALTIENELDEKSIRTNALSIATSWVRMSWPIVILLLLILYINS